jgi:hypothetical protein
MERLKNAFNQAKVASIAKKLFAISVFANTIMSLLIANQ